MKEGDVVLARLVQADGASKIRPAVLLRRLPNYGDFPVCGVSTQLQRRVVGFDDVLSPADDDFSLSGVNDESLIRLGFLGLLSLKQIIGSIGSISAVRHQRLLRTLADYLVKSPATR